MKIYLGSDHAGFELKEKVKSYLSQNYEIVDSGALEFDANDDYPDFVAKTAENVSKDQNSLGIIFGKSGAGEAIVANKFKNVRAVLGFSKENVQLSKEHNNANILSLGSDFVDFEKAKGLVDAFLNTEFSNEDRHRRRVEKIKQIEEKNYA